MKTKNKMRPKPNGSERIFSDQAHCWLSSSRMSIKQ